MGDIRYLLFPFTHFKFFVRLDSSLLKMQSLFLALLDSTILETGKESAHCNVYFFTDTFFSLKLGLIYFQL